MTNPAPMADPDPRDWPGVLAALTQDAFGWGIVASYVWKEAPFAAGGGWRPCAMTR